MCACVCTSACTHAWVCRSQEVHTSLPHLFETGSLSQSVAPRFGYYCWPASLSGLLVSTSPALGTWVHPCQPFHRRWDPDLEPHTCAPKQELYPLSHLHNPVWYILNNVLVWMTFTLSILLIIVKSHIVFVSYWIIEKHSQDLIFNTKVLLVLLFFFLPGNLYHKFKFIIMTW